MYELLDALMQMHGVQITVRSVTRTYNDYGDATETYTDSTVDAILIPASRASQNAVAFGEVQSVDVTVYAKTEISQGDLIVYGGKTYRVLKSEDFFNGWYRMYCQEEV